MSYTIPPGTPKALKAAAFGRELVKACEARGIPLKELERATGVGHTSIDNYRRGLSLPKVEVARSLASALDWPRLGRMIEEARTFTCARTGCSRTFRNDTGAPRKYCSASCQRIAENARIAQRRARRAGQTGDKRATNAMVARLRSGLRIADERAKLAEDAIAAMCAGCEPDGVCRTTACPLRMFSPLPLAVHDDGRPRTSAEIRDEASRKAAPARSAAMQRLWSDPEWAERQRAASAAGQAAMTDEARRLRGQRISAARRGRPSQPAPWSDERRANHRAAMRAHVERRRQQREAAVPA